MARLAPFALAALVLAAAGAPKARGEVREVRSAHYLLRSEGPAEEAAEWSRVLEAAWPQYETFFSATPKLAEDERLRVTFVETQERFLQAIRDAGGRPPGAAGVGGYYDPISRGVFFWRQPTTWWTRTLLLHECAHQFHYLAKTGNRPPAASWYVEGIAEHLGHHTWDGKTLRLGVVPPISLEDYAGKALAAVNAPGFRLDALLQRGASVGRPEGMHLVRYLATSEATRKRWPAFADRLDHGAVPDPADFVRAFGPLARLEPKWKEWLATVQQPLVVGFVDWDARGPAAVRGRSAVVSACRAREPVRKIGASFRTPEGSWRAGLLLRWAGLEDYTLFLVEDGARAVVDDRKDSAWHRLAGPLPVEPPAEAPWRVEAERTAAGVRVTVNGRPFGPFVVPGEGLGLALDHAAVEFTDVALER